MSQNDQAHFKNLAANVTRFLKCDWPIWDIIHERVNTRKELGVSKSRMKLSNLNIHNLVESEICKFERLCHWHLNELYNFFFPKHSIIIFSDGGFKKNLTKIAKKNVSQEHLWTAASASSFAFGKVAKLITLGWDM